MTARDKVYVLSWRGVTTRPVEKITATRVYFADDRIPRFVDSFSDDGYVVKYGDLYAWSLNGLKRATEGRRKVRVEVAEAEIESAVSEYGRRLAHIDAAEKEATQ